MVAGDRAGIRAGAALHVEATLVRAERRILVEVHAAPVLACECVRCLAPISARLPVSFELTLVPAEEYEEQEQVAAEDKAHHPVAGSFDLAHAEEEAYVGRVVDLDPILREQVVLALPGYPVCQEGCKGLCSVCGKNLNEGECGCVRKVPDPRWAGLAKVKLT